MYPFFALVCCSNFTRPHRAMREGKFLKVALRLLENLAFWAVTVAGCLDRRNREEEAYENRDLGGHVHRDRGHA